MRMMLPLRLVCLALLATGLARTQTPPESSLPPPERAFRRLYHLDFAGARAIMDEYRRTHPDDPLAPAVLAASDLFSELHRLRILETDFFMNDDSVITRKKLKANPEFRSRFFKEVEEARRLGQAVLDKQPEDRNALFAMCVAASVVVDYTGLVERRQWASLNLSRQTQLYARKLLALKPPVYDAYLAMGAVEYVVGSMPFFLRWFVRFPDVQGSKQKGIDNLRLTAEHGHYYAPYAKVLLAVCYLREKRLPEAEQMLSSFAQEFPENPLIRNELTKIRERIAAKPPGSKR